MKIVTPPQSTRNNPTTHSPEPPGHLSARDRQVLDVRAIAPDIRDARGYRTITADEASAYGFRGDQARDGLLIPCHNTQGFNGSYQLRPHDPRLNDAGKPIKYDWPAGARLTLDVPLAAQPLLDDVSVPLLITESPIKADAIMSAAEPGTVAVIACIGVWGWRSGGVPLSDWRDIPLCTKQGGKISTRRRVTILFDSDTATNPKVAYARQDLTEFLERRGGSIQHVDIPTDPAGAKQGIDDALNGGHTLAGLLATARPPRPVAPVLSADDPDRQRIAELEAKVADLTEQLETERRERHEEHRILGDSRRPAQERISAVVFNWHVNRIAQHGEGAIGRGGGLAPVTAVDATGIYTSVKLTAEASGTSPKNMGDYLKKWQAERLLSQSVTRVRTGEAPDPKSGEIRATFESIARVQLRGDISAFLHDFYMAAPVAVPRKKPVPKDRCLDHPDADIVRRVTVECSVCHQQIGEERVSQHRAGTPPEIQDEEARLFDLDTEAQNTPEVISENAPRVISANETPRVNAAPSVAPTSSLSHLRLLQTPQSLWRTPVDRYTDVTIGGRQ